MSREAVLWYFSSFLFPPLSEKGEKKGRNEKKEKGEKREEREREKEEQKEGSVCKTDPWWALGKLNFKSFPDTAALCGLMKTQLLVS